MQFVNPLWIFAAAAISIPVIIHLWNIRPGKTLKVGSIALIDSASRKRSRSFNLLQLLLLFLRCLFLLLLAFLLAKPFFQNKINFNKQKGWILIPKENFKETLNKFKSTADSLLKAGYELHYFEPGFKLVDTLSIVKDTTLFSNVRPANFWSNLKQLNALLPGGINVYLFTPSFQNHFYGERPASNLNLHWQIYTPKDSINSWIDQAWFKKDKAIQFIEGTSRPSGTFYSTKSINSGYEDSSKYRVAVSKGKATIGLKGSNEPAAIIDTSALIIEVFADNNQLDAGYLKAAIESVQQFTGRNIIVKPFSDAISNADWLFWLSDKPLNQEILSRFKNVLSYVPGKIVNEDSWLTDADNYAITSGLPKIAIHRKVEWKGTGDAIWHDGFGDPVLAVEKNGNRSRFYLTSHFNTAWNDLVWDNNFPTMLLNLILKPAFNNKHDNRVIDGKTLILAKADEDLYSQTSVFENTEIAQYIWFLLALIFFAERWLAFKTEV